MDQNNNTVCKLSSYKKRSQDYSKSPLISQAKQHNPQIRGARKFYQDNIANLVHQIKKSNSMQDEINKIQQHLNKRPPFLRVKQSKKKIISVTKYSNRSQNSRQEIQRYDTHIYQSNLAKISQDCQEAPSKSPYFTKLLSSQGVFKILKSKIPNVPASVEEKWQSNSFTTVSIATFGRKKFKIKSISSLIASVNAMEKSNDAKTNAPTKVQQVTRAKEKSHSITSSPLASLKPKFMDQNSELMPIVKLHPETESLGERSPQPPSFSSLSQSRRNAYRSSPSIDSKKDDNISNKIKAFITLPSQARNNNCNISNNNKNKKDTSGLKQYFFSKKLKLIQNNKSSSKKIIKSIHHQVQQSPQYSPQKGNLINNTASAEFRKSMTLKGSMRQNWTSISQSSSSSSMLGLKHDNISSEKKKNKSISKAQAPSISTSCTPTQRKILLPQIISKKNQNRMTKQFDGKVIDQAQDDAKNAYKYSRKLKGNLMKIFSSTTGSSELLSTNESDTSQNVEGAVTNKNSSNINNVNLARRNLIKLSMGKCLSARNHLSKSSIRRTSIK